MTVTEISENAAMLATAVVTEDSSKSRVFKSETVALFHINEAVASLINKYNSAAKKTKGTVTVEFPTVWYDLPANIGLISVEFTINNYVSQLDTKDYLVRDLDDITQIQISSGAGVRNNEYTIIYLQAPADVSEGSDTPAIKDRYHWALCNYVAYKMLIGLPAAPVFLSDFNRLARQAHIALTKKKKFGIKIANHRAL